jgi:VanZ family protein
VALVFLIEDSSTKLFSDEKHYIIEAIMDLYTKEEREVLILEYETLHKENWERGQNVWLLNTILITGSLIVSFQSNMKSFPTPSISLFLVVIAFLIHATSNQVTATTYKRMEKIREHLRMTEVTRMYRSIRGKPWYLMRKNVPFTLYLVLGCTYLFLINNDLYIAVIAFVAGFFVILVSEGLDSIRRETEEANKRI